jgi:RNA polymerase sigma factor (sigma-70 family)
MQQELIPHLFRTEFSKIAAVLVKHLGIGHLEAAEDITSETFLSALETWSYKGIPENPTAWLYVVAKNKAKNYLSREKVFLKKIVPEIKHADSLEPEIDIDLSEKNISDSQLQMLFAICHPSIPPESQTGLALRILCGFGIDEIANAFLTNKETVNKRLYRAREKLRTENIPIEFPGKAELPARLDAVLMTLYLLFNEGYYSESHDVILREDLCFDAMRLVKLLIDHEPTNLPNVNALLSLMCFHASRFAARKNEKGRSYFMKTRMKACGTGNLSLGELISFTSLQPEINFPGTTWKPILLIGILLKKIHLTNGKISFNYIIISWYWNIPRWLHSTGPLYFQK